MNHQGQTNLDFSLSRAKKNQSKTIVLLSRNSPFFCFSGPNAAATTSNYMKKVSMFVELRNQIMTKGVNLHESQPPYPSEATQMPSREARKCKSPQTLHTQ